MPQLPAVARRLIERLPSYDVAPRIRARYEAIAAARDAAAAQARASESPHREEYFPWAAKDPGRSFVLDSGLHVSLDDRWFICGEIGCGKTTLARELVGALARLYPMAGVNVLDSKGDGLFDDDPGLWESDEIPPVAGPGEWITWKPGADDIAAYSEWFERIREKRRPCIVYVDELSSLTKGERTHAPGFGKLIKQGRSLHQCVITLSQETAGIDRRVRTQLMHILRMRLTDDFDAARMDRMLHGAVKPRREPARPHGLWHRRIGGGPAREYDDWRALLM